MLGSSELVGDDPYRIDLGGAEVIVTARAGHTASDLTVTITDPHTVFCGDLLWNGMVPNYRDATPSVLAESVRAMLADDGATFVPGHGSIPSPAERGDYVALLDDLEATARRAFEAGVPAAEAARAYRAPSAVARWTLFNEAYFEVALRAWERELRGG